LPSLHVHVDESGCFGFSPKGSAFYVFGVAWTFDPEPLASAITRARFSLLKAGFNIEAFHAHTDRQAHRDLFVKTVVAFDTWNFAALVVEKRKVNPAIRAPEIFYPRFLSSILRFIFRGTIGQSASSLTIFTDSIPLNKKREAAEKAIKTACRTELKTIPFEIFHHPEQCNNWIQVADYCTWAVARKWERKDTRTYDQLRDRLHAPELDALRNGSTFYY
jgi:Protein of unknown function (DUF3800)